MDANLISYAIDLALLVTVIFVLEAIKKDVRAIRQSIEARDR